MSWLIDVLALIKMSDHPYAFLALFFAVAVAFPLLMLTVARMWFRFFQPSKPSLDKNEAYECGVPSTGDSWIQFRAHYYLYAILFLIFDVELLFLLPFAVAFTGLPASALVAMLVFVLLLGEGLVWAWQRGHLEWR
jgi:NADH-quinone oxidoreductase subunit A